MCGNSQIYRYRIDVPIETVFEEYNLAGREKAQKDKTEWTNLTLESYRALVVLRIPKSMKTRKLPGIKFSK